MTHDMQLRDEEFAALVGLLFWNTSQLEGGEVTKRHLQRSSSVPRLSIK